MYNQRRCMYNNACVCTTKCSTNYRTLQLGVNNKYPYGSFGDPPSTEDRRFGVTAPALTGGVTALALTGGVTAVALPGEPPGTEPSLPLFGIVIHKEPRPSISRNAILCKDDGVRMLV